MPKKTLMKPAVMTPLTYEKVKRQPQKKFTVLFMGHYTKIKGVDIFIALSQMPSMIGYEFCIAGEIPKKDKSLFKRVLEVGERSPNLTVFGHLNSPQAVISNCDVLLIPYRSGATVLSVAQSALEAMAAGKPVITTPNTATNDLVIDGVNGYICSSISSMEERLLALKHDPCLYNKLAQNAVATIKREFDIEERAKQLMRFLNAEL
ncbi:MAG: glycosyltransferase [Victivallales bacterium]|nr:glycosyltransferase [Victivallales bacterium]